MFNVLDTLATTSKPQEDGYLWVVRVTHSYSKDTHVESEWKSKKEAELHIQSLHYDFIFVDKVKVEDNGEKTVVSTHIALQLNI